MWGVRSERARKKKKDGNFRRISVFDISQTVLLDGGGQSAQSAANSPAVLPEAAFNSPVELFETEMLEGKVAHYGEIVGVLEDITPPFFFAHQFLSAFASRRVLWGHVHHRPGRHPEDRPGLWRLTARGGTGGIVLLKYRVYSDRIALKDRKAINQICLSALEDDPPSMTPEEIYNKFTGIGGLHGLDYVDFGSYSDFSEAKKESEQGQFFTSDPVRQWVVDCIRPEYRRRIADLTCGKGSFFNHISNEEKVYGCEIDPDSFAVARHCFPNANLTLCDIRTYNPGVRFNVVVGNPPYNLNWTYGGKKMDSQTVYILKAAELLFPGGMLAVIVPETYLGESNRKVDIKRIDERFNRIVQVRIDPNAFAWLGVRTSRPSC